MNKASADLNAQGYCCHRGASNLQRIRHGLERLRCNAAASISLGVCIKNETKVIHLKPTREDCAYFTSTAGLPHNGGVSERTEPTQSFTSRFNTKTGLTFATSDTYFLVDFREADAPEGIFNRLNDKAKSLKTQSERYPTTKLMQVFIVWGLASYLPKQSTPVIMNCTNPGLCHSELSRELDGLKIRVLKLLEHPEKAHVIWSLAQAVG